VYRVEWRDDEWQEKGGGGNRWRWERMAEKDGREKVEEGKVG